MSEDGIWVCRRNPIKRVHQPRHRRDCLGELVQINGYEDWRLQDHGPQRTLLVFVFSGRASASRGATIVSQDLMLPPSHGP